MGIFWIFGFSGTRKQKLDFNGFGMFYHAQNGPEKITNTSGTTHVQYIFSGTIFSIIFIYFFIGLFLFVFQRQITFNKTSKPKKPEYYNLEEIKEIFIETYDNL